MLDAEVNELWRSGVGVVSDSGWQCTAELSGTMSGSGESYTIPAMQIIARSFALRVKAGAATGTRAKSIVVEASPQLHVADSDKLPRTRMTGLTGNSPKFSCWMPGVMTDGEADTQRHAAEVLAAADRLESMMTRVGRIELGEEAVSVDVHPTSAPTVEEEISAVKKATASAAASSDNSDSDNPLAQIIASGRSFAAKCVVQNGDTTIWGNISAVESGEEEIMWSAAATSDNPWEAAVKIEIGAKSHVTRCEGSGNCPESLNALVKASNSQATRATIYVENLESGVIKEASVELTPAPSGLYAYSLHSGLAPIPMTGSALDTLPAATAMPPSVSRLSGSVIAAHSAAPLRGVCGTTVSQSEIKALAAAVKSQASWDFSRCHVYAMATDGIYAVAANTRSGAVSASKIDQRGVSDAHAVASTPDGVVAIAAGEVVRCSASRASELAALPEAQASELKQVAWDSRNKMLYFTDALGNVLVRSDKGWHNILVPERVTEARNAMGTIWLTGTESSFILRPSGESHGDTHVEWRSNLHLEEAAMAREVTVRMSASSFDGTVKLRAHNGAAAPFTEPLVTLKIKGAVNAPIRLPLCAPWRYGVTLEISGEASSDFQLRGLRVNAISGPKLRY